MGEKRRPEAWGPFHKTWHSANTFAVRRMLCGKELGGGSTDEWEAMLKSLERLNSDLSGNLGNMANGERERSVGRENRANIRKNGWRQGSAGTGESSHTPHWAEEEMAAHFKKRCQGVIVFDEHPCFHTTVYQAVTHRRRKQEREEGSKQAVVSQPGMATFSIYSFIFGGDSASPPYVRRLIYL